jgi:hypothetical protein
MGKLAVFVLMMLGAALAAFDNCTPKVRSTATVEGV